MKEVCRINSVKKNDSKHDNQNKNIVMIWCPHGENFQYIKVCGSNCKKKDKCEPFKDYLEPKLF